MDTTLQLNPLAKRWGIALALVVCVVAGPVDAGDVAPAADSGSIPIGQGGGTADAPVQSPVATQGPASQQLTEVVVTATKRARSVRDIPATVNVITGEKLESMGAQSVEDYIKLVPGVTETNDGIYAMRISVRGVSADVGTNLTTGVLIGDVPFSDPFLPRVTLDPNPFDLSDIEVLKGPQGTLFGGTGLNGSIRYVPEAPRFNEYDVKYFEQYKYYDGQHSGGSTYGGEINLPISKEYAALRVVGFDRLSPGYIDDLNANAENDNKTHQNGFRGILALRPFSALDVSAMYIIQNTRVADLPVADNPSGQFSRDDTPRMSPNRAQYNIANLGLTLHLDWADLISQSSRTGKRYHSFNDVSRELNGQIPLLSAPDDNRSSALTQEIRLASPNDPARRFNFVIGLFGQRVKQFDCSELAVGIPSLLGINIPLNELPLVSPTPCPGNLADVGSQLVGAHFLDQTTSQEVALFGESSLKFWRGFEATVGARLYRTDVSGTQSYAGLLEATNENVLLNAAQLTTVSGDQKGDGIAPKAALAYHFDRNLMAYAQVNRGYRFGGFNPYPSTATVQIPAQFKSDSLWNYEAGLRTRWFKKTLSVDVTGFYIKWKNPQLYQTQGTTAFFSNVGGARGEGGEASINYRFPFLRGLSLGIAAAYTDTATTVPFTTEHGTATTPGTAWPLAPHWQTSTNLSYQVALGSWGFEPSVLHTYSSHAWNNLDHQASIYGYQTVDATLRISNLEREWCPEIIFSANNIANSRGLSSETINSIAPGLGATDYVYIPPRSLNVRIQGHF